jgi:hypothetical protein
MKSHLEKALEWVHALRSEEVIGATTGVLEALIIPQPVR